MAGDAEVGQAARTLHYHICNALGGAEAAPACVICPLVPSRCHASAPFIDREATGNETVLNAFCRYFERSRSTLESWLPVPL
jgi:hypothetical protein